MIEPLIYINQYSKLDFFAERLVILIHTDIGQQLLININQCSDQLTISLSCGLVNTRVCGKTMELHKLVLNQRLIGDLVVLMWIYTNCIGVIKSLMNIHHY